MFSPKKNLLNILIHIDISELKKISSNLSVDLKIINAHPFVVHRD